jgi:hypothetical protein
MVSCNNLKREQGGGIFFSEFRKAYTFRKIKFCGFYSNCVLNFDTFKLGYLEEKGAVKMWNLGNISAVAIYRYSLLRLAIQA